jgi:transcriptional regulator with XRE-family HTH domain
LVTADADDAGMSNRRHRVAEAERRMRRQLAEALDEIHERRLMSGATQADLAEAVGVSRSLVGALERDELEDPGVVELARMAAAVGLDLSLRTFAGGAVLRDAAQVRLLNRLRAECHPSLAWTLKAPVAPGDPRAFDALLGHRPNAAAVEAISRLRDSQRQSRPIQAKLETSALPAVIPLVAASRGNRVALREAGRQLGDAYPLGSRAVLGMLRNGEVPRQNGIVLL